MDYLKLCLGMIAIGMLLKGLAAFIELFRNK